MNIINTFIDQWANIVESGNLDEEIGDIVSETPAQDADDEEFWKTRYDSDAMMSDNNRKDMARTMREISDKKYSPLYLVFVLSSLVGKDKIPEIDAEIADAAKYCPLAGEFLKYMKWYLQNRSGDRNQFKKMFADRDVYESSSNCK